MSETNDSGNRWEKSAESPAESPDESHAEDLGVDEVPAAPPEPVEVPAAPAATVAPAQAPSPAAAPRASRVPGWVTGRGLATAGVAAAIFLGGGGIGYAVGASHDDGRQVPSRFDRADFHGPAGQFPGNGQLPGGPGQGQNFSGPNSQVPQSQSQDDGSSSGASS